MTPWVLSTWLACTGGSADPPPPEPAPAPRPALSIGQQPAVVEPAPAAPQPEPDAPDAPITRDMCDDLEDGGPVDGPDCVTGTVASSMRISVRVAVTIIVSPGEISEPVTGDENSKGITAGTVASLRVCMYHSGACRPHACLSFYVPVR